MGQIIVPKACGVKFLLWQRKKLFYLQCKREWFCPANMACRGARLWMKSKYVVENCNKQIFFRRWLATSIPAHIPEKKSLVRREQHETLSGRRSDYVPVHIYPHTTQDLQAKDLRVKGIPQNNDKEMCCAVEALLCTVHRSRYGVTLNKTHHISGSIRRGRTLWPWLWLLRSWLQLQQQSATINGRLLSWWHQQIKSHEYMKVDWEEGSSHH